MCSIREGALFKRAVYLVNLDLLIGLEVKWPDGLLAVNNAQNSKVRGRFFREVGLFARLRSIIQCFVEFERHSKV